MTLVVVIVVALFFDFTNGFHDTANSIAMGVSTRALSPRAAHRDRTVDVFVRKLREKVDRRAPKHTFIQTRFAVGYKLEPQPKSALAD